LTVATTRRASLAGALGALLGCRDEPPASPSAAARETLDVRYLPGSESPKHRLDVFAPATPGAAFVHFVHGGYWVSGDKGGGGHGAGLYASIGRALSARGIGCVLQSYRLASEVGIDGMVEDVLAALAWTTAHAVEHGGDAARIFVMGHSAGGHLAALAASDPSLRRPDVRLAGCIALSAIWDVEDMAATQGEGFNADVTYRVFGRDAAVWRARSPLTHLGAATPPMLVAVGERDFGYLVPQARRAYDKLRAAGAPAELLVVPDHSHMDLVLGFGSGDDDMALPVASFVISPAPRSPR
jgi:acetyl esterase/lipase